MGENWTVSFNEESKIQDPQEREGENNNDKGFMFAIRF